MSSVSVSEGDIHDAAAINTFEPVIANTRLSTRSKTATIEFAHRF